MSWKPTVLDTEEDLLALQKQFLDSKERPAAKLSKVSITKDKKKDVSADDTEEQKQKHGDPFERKDKGQIMKDIKERDVTNYSRSSLSFQSKKGFPIVQAIPKDKLANLSKSCTQSKKSIFSQHFESLGPKEFGIAAAENPLKTSIHSSLGLSERDRVDAMILEPVTLPKSGIEEEESKGFDSKSSLVWDQFLRSTLVSGEGLTAVGASSKTVSEEMERIHQENIAELSKMSEEEIKREQEKLRKQLGPGLVKFLESRRKLSSRKEESIEKEPPRVGVSFRKEEPIQKEPPGVGVSNVSTSDQPRWLNMDKIEKEKLEWMKDVPINIPSQAYKEVRFSMDGLVINRSVGVGIPTHLALHHHGDEPEAAGYTLKELLHLSCSSVLQQRVISLKTLASISRRARHNEYRGVIEGSTMDALLESGMPTILRYALDDSSQNVLTESIHCLHALLISDAEEYVLENYTYCYQGLSLPRLPSFVSSGGSKEEEEVEEIIKKDIVDGLLRMMLLPRLRYILEVCQPTEEVTTMIIEILIHISRHSLNSTSQIINCPRLMNIVREQFLCPIDENASKKPHPKAMKLVRTLCSAGRHTAKNLLASHNILEVVLRHCVIHPSAHSLPPTQSHQLYLESARTWTVLLAYGLTSDTFSDIFPTFLQHLSSCSTVSTMSSDELLRNSSLFNLLTASVHVSAVTPAMLRIGGPHPSPSLSWSLAEGLINSTLSCMTNVLREIESFSDTKDFSLDRVQYIASLQHLVATYFSELSEKPELRYNPVDLLQQVESLVSSITARFTASRLYHLALETISSCLEALPPTPPLPSSLSFHIPVSSSISAVFGYNPPPNSSHQEAPDTHTYYTLIVFADLVRSHVRLSCALVHLHHGVEEKVVKGLTSDGFMDMLEHFNSLEPERISWFLIPFYLLVNSAIRLLFQHEPNPSFSKSLCRCVFKLLVSLPSGLEAQVTELLSTTVFNSLLYKHLGHGDPEPPSLVSAAITKLPSIKETYLHCLKQTGLSEAALASSLVWKSQNPILMDTLLLPCYKGSLLPIDWPLLPLIQEYNKSQSGNNDVDGSVITNALLYILLMECCHGDIMGTIPLAARLARVMCVFLTGPDLFFEKHVCAVLTELLLCYCSSPIDFSVPLPGLPSFYDFYMSLLDHYSAVSYGDPLFSKYVILPLQQSQLLALRRAFWIDHTHITRIVSLSHQEVPVPINSFLIPVEQDWDLLQQYLKLLVSKTLTFKRNPFLSLVALHHTHSFIFCEPVQKNRTQHQRSLLEHVLRVPDQSLVKMVLLYWRPAEDGSVALRDTLSDSQRELIRETGLKIPSFCTE